MQVVERQIETPAGAWNAWIEYYRPMAEHGIPVFRLGNAMQIEMAIADARFLRWLLWALAAIFAVIAAGAAFRPKPVPVKTRR
jgi:hypothetical protein